MLQRIQTVYLLIIVALMVATLFLPLAMLQAGDQFYSFDATGVSTIAAEPELVYPTWGLFALTAVISILSLITIFLFKKRMLQIRNPDAGFLCPVRFLCMDIERSAGWCSAECEDCPFFPDNRIDPGLSGYP